MTSTHALEQRLRTALAAKAAGVIIDEAPFDAERAANLEVLDPVRGPGPSHSQAVWVAVAAAAAILLASLWLVRTPSSEQGTAGNGAGTSGSALTPLPSAAAEPTTVPLSSLPQLVARSLPAGYDVWHMELPFRSKDPAIRRTVQLIEAPASGSKILLDFQVASPGEAGGGAPTTVRGQAGMMLPFSSADPFLGAPSDGYEITWSEDGARVRATVRGLALTEAIAVLDQQQWSDPSDAVGGFAPPPTRAWRTFVAPDVRWLPSGAAYPSLATYYARSAPTPGPLEIGVTTATAIPLEQYLTDVFAGEAQPDGSYVAYRDYAAIGGNRANGRLTRVWPDGRRAQVLAVDPAPHDAATLESIAASISELDGVEVAALQRSVLAKRAAVPDPPETVLRGNAPAH